MIVDRWSTVLLLLVPNAAFIAVTLAAADVAGPAPGPVLRRAHGRTCTAGSGRSPMPWSTSVRYISSVSSPGRSSSTSPGSPRGAHRAGQGGGLPAGRPGTRPASPRCRPTSGWAGHRDARRPRVRDFRVLVDKDVIYQFSERSTPLRPIKERVRLVLRESLKPAAGLATLRRYGRSALRRRRTSTTQRPVRRARSPGTDSARAVDDPRSHRAPRPPRA